MSLALLYRFSDVLFHVHLYFGNIRFLNGLHMPADDDKKFPGISLCLNRFAILFLVGLIFVSAHSFLGLVAFLL